MRYPEPTLSMNWHDDKPDGLDDAVYSPNAEQKEETQQDHVSSRVDAIGCRYSIHRLHHG